MFLLKERLSISVHTPQYSSVPASYSGRLDFRNIVRAGIIDGVRQYQRMEASRIGLGETRGDHGVQLD
jgi:hypothetical protein